MKKSVLKIAAFAILTLNILMVCLEIRNVKIIIDEQSFIGVELDFSDAQVSLKQTETPTQTGEVVAMP